MKKETISNSDVEKQAYIDNRKSLVADFYSNIKENKIDKFTWHAIFVSIKNQEEFIEHISKNSHQYASLNEEKEILKTFLKEAKAVYGNDFDAAYLSFKKEKLK